MLTFRVYLQCACSLYTWDGCLWGEKKCLVPKCGQGNSDWLLWLYIGQEEHKIKLQAASSYEPVAVIPQIFSYNLLLYKFSFWKPESTSNALEIVSETFLDGVFHLMPLFPKPELGRFIMGYLLIWCLKGEACCCRTQGPIWIRNLHIQDFPASGIIQ